MTYSQFDSNIRIFYVFLGFFRNTLKYFIQRPIFKPLYFYNDFFKILENTSFWAPLRNTRISYVTSMNNPIEITKFAMCGLCFFVRVIEYTITIAKTFIVITKTITLSSIDECNQNWMTLFTFQLHFEWKSY